MTNYRRCPSILLWEYTEEVKISEWISVQILQLVHAEEMVQPTGTIHLGAFIQKCSA